MPKGAIAAFSDVGIEEDYEVAGLARLNGARVGVRIWLGLTRQEMDLIDYFNFVPHGMKEEVINRYLRPLGQPPVWAHYHNLNRLGISLPRTGRISRVGIATAIMGTNRMIEAARETRREFLSMNLS